MMMETVSFRFLSNYPFSLLTPVCNVARTQRAAVDLPKPEGEGAVSLQASRMHSVELGFLDCRL